MAEQNGSEGAKWYTQFNRYASIAVLVSGLALQAGVVINRVEAVRSDVSRIAISVNANTIELAARSTRLSELERRMDGAERRIETMMYSMGRPDSNGR